MVTIPKGELTKFKNLVLGNAKRFGLTPEAYLRKVWYHEEASKLGEYVALVLMDELLPLIPTTDSDKEEENQVS